MVLLVIHGIKELRRKVDECINLVDDWECVSIWIAGNCWLAPDCCSNDVHLFTGMDDVLKWKLVLPFELRINSSFDLNRCCISTEHILIEGCFGWVKIRTLYRLNISLIPGLSLCIVVILHVDSFDIGINVIVYGWIGRENLWVHLYFLNWNVEEVVGGI